MFQFHRAVPAELIYRLSNVPENIDLFFDGGEVFVTGGEKGFALGGESGQG